MYLAVDRHDRRKAARAEARHGLQREQPVVRGFFLAGKAQILIHRIVDRAGSVGSENETVLLLGEDAENKTVPVILCAEENVEGSHGATIGELDADTLFYFASRGIDRAAAEAILARAAVERLARMAEDEAFSARALGALAQVLCMKEERE